MPTATPISAPLLLACLLSFASASYADAPLFSKWLEIKVSSCEKKTFRAHGDGGGRHVPGDSHTTAVVQGTVTKNGAEPYDASDLMWSQVAAEAVKSLPQVGEAVTVVLPAWEPEVCAVLQNATERFDYDYRCDIYVREGPCLPPFTLVSIHGKDAFDLTACDEDSKVNAGTLREAICPMARIKPR